MPATRDTSALDFSGTPALGAGLSGLSRSLRPSGILKIAGEVRALAAQGRPLCNLTVGDFHPGQFPVPDRLRRLVVAALEAGETNYPPTEGLFSLREAVAEYTARTYGVTWPVESVLITSGGRPAIYGAYRCLVDPGESVLYAVPSWNNDHYTGFVNARPVVVTTRREAGFQPTLADLAPHLGEAALLCLCSPNNPTGTILRPGELGAILEAVVGENRRREAAGRKPLFVLFDLMYGTLVFRGAEHPHPLELVPEAAPWLVMVDGISKAFAATGLRVGWAIGHPVVIARIRDLLSHVGAWAPRPEQVATAAFLREPDAVEAARASLHEALTARLDALHEGFQSLKAAGFPTDSVRPEGAIYLAARIAPAGFRLDGATIRNAEETREVLLQRAGVAVVPFEAFGYRGEPGWFRLSAGAVSMTEIAGALGRIRELLEQAEPA